MDYRRYIKFTKQVKNRCRMILFNMSRMTNQPTYIETRGKEYNTIYMRELRYKNVENFLDWNLGIDKEEGEIFNYNDLHYIRQMNKEWDKSREK